MCIRDRSWDDEIATVVVNPFKLGDYSLGRQGVLGDFVGIIPSSNESSLFFVNGKMCIRDREQAVLTVPHPILRNTILPLE